MFYVLVSMCKLIMHIIAMNSISFNGKISFYVKSLVFFSMYQSRRQLSQRFQFKDDFFYKKRDFLLKAFTHVLLT